MHTYRVCNLALLSDVLLPELPTSTISSVDCEFTLLTAGNLSNVNVAWFHRWIVSQNIPEESREQLWLRFGRIDDGYLLRFPSCADFFISTDTSQICCRPLQGVPEATVRHLLIDQVIPLVLSRREQIVLHASAILTLDGVIAFVAKSGKGKSTLATSFVQNGFPLVSDDCLVLRIEQGGWTALPSYPGIRLWPGAARSLLVDDAATADVAGYTTKRRIGNFRILPFYKLAAPIRQLFLLSDDSSNISFERLTAARAFMAIMELTYNLDISDTALLRTQFETVGRLTAEVPLYTFHYPREFGSLPAVREAILHHLQEDRRCDIE